MELCDYYNNRVIHRGSEAWVASQSEEIENKETPEQQMYSTTVDGDHLDGPPIDKNSHIGFGSNNEILETPLQEDIENTLPPNSVEAPLKEPCQYVHNIVEGATPVLLPTPPQIMNKSQDL